MEDQKESGVKKYIPHKLRSRPLRCITLPAICILIFIAYWLILCPLIYIVVQNDYENYYKFDHKNEENNNDRTTWPSYWPFLFWTVAFFIFVIIMLIIVLIWRCIKERERAEELVRRNEYDTLIKKRKGSGVKELYHVSLINEKATNTTNSKDQLNVSTDTLTKPTVENQRNTMIIELNKRLSKIEEKHKNNIEKEKSENPTDFAKCSVKRRPDLNLETNRPLSQISTTSLPRSPLTPRDLFFIDLIEAANSSPAAFIPPTETFLDHERKNCLPSSSLESLNGSSEENSSDLASENPPAKVVDHRLKSDTDDNSPKVPSDQPKKDSQSEYFIANVHEEKTQTAEVFLFVDGGEPKKELKIKMCDDVFTD